MTKNITHKVIMLFFSISLVISNFACQSTQKAEYYAQKDNYVTATGTVAHISFDEDSQALYIDFSALTPTFDDTCFKIVGKNYDCVKERGIKELLNVGDTIEFVTAPKYFGDGYVMPIVSISANGETFLAFDEGYTNLIAFIQGGQ